MPSPNTKSEPAHEISVEFPDQEELEDIVQVAAQVCSTAISAVSIISRDRLIRLSSVGVNTGETPLEHSFCKYAVESGDLFIVPDAISDPRFHDHPAVTSPGGVRFYAGIPLRSTSDVLIGTLCVADSSPKKLSDVQMRTLRSLGRHVERCMELRLMNERLKELAAESEAHAKRLQDSHDLLAAFLNNGPFLTYIKDAGGRFVFYNDRLAERFGVEGDEWIGRSDLELWPDEMATEIRAHDLEVLQVNAALEMVEESVEADGSITPWRSYKFPFTSGDGSIMLAGVSVDITKERERESTLTDLLRERTQSFLDHESTHFVLLLFMNNSPHHAYLKSEDGRYIYYNKSFARHYSISEREWVGRTDHEIFSGNRADEMRKQELLLLVDGECPELLECHYSADGGFTTFRTLKFTYRNAEGQHIIAGLSIKTEKDAGMDASLEVMNMPPVCV